VRIKKSFINNFSEIANEKNIESSNEKKKIKVQVDEIDVEEPKISEQTLCNQLKKNKLSKFKTFDHI
jgi:hypothetical protein